MNTSEIRNRFLIFFKKHQHAILESASLVTSDKQGVTNSTLFNTAGVQPLVPYILGEPHPSGNRLASAQKCVRTIDIDEVGDNTHLTFFEMLGNWSLGDYFKEEAIKLSFLFLTDKNEGLGLDPKRLYVTVFAGDKNASKDEEAFNIWKKYLPENRIYFKGADSNWWPAVKNEKDSWTGPTGPCTEMFYDVNGDLGDINLEGFIEADDQQKIVEIWNDVFMQYEKIDGKIIDKLKRFTVDTGAGLERLATIINNKTSVYDTDIFYPIIEEIIANSKKYNIKYGRIIADHIKSSIFLIADGVMPSNSDRGYIVRRLIRRSIRLIDAIEGDRKIIEGIYKKVVEKYSDVYPNIKSENVLKIILEEENKFRKTIKQGIREFEKIIKNKPKEISGKESFILFSTYGFPIELIVELAKEKEILVNIEDFNREIESHQELSRKGAEKKFKGGLAGSSEIEIKYHTATHLLHQALRDVLGEKISQKGSNINSERLRFDFSHSEKISDEQKKLIEKIINQKIKEALPVQSVIMDRENAEKTGALHFFGDKYGDQVSIYFIGDSLETAYSKEFCGGPHVKNTQELGLFEIVKEEAVSAGVRRIKAILK